MSSNYGMRCRGALSEARLYICNRVIAHVPSHAIRLAFYRRIMGFEIGERSFIFMDAWFDCRHGLRIGHDSVINQKCRLDTRGGIVVGNHVGICAESAIFTAEHDPSSSTFSAKISPVIIEDYGFIGTRAMILPGVTIGKGAVVAAGAIVTKDVAPFTVVAGVPAREIGKRNPQLGYETAYSRLFF